MGVEMTNEYLEIYYDFSNLICDENRISGNSVLEILKKYSTGISVFDMMEFSSQIIEENKYVQESYREDSEKSYIESFLLRIRDIIKDDNDYKADIDRKSLIEAIEILKSHYENETDSTRSKVQLIFYIASLYATFILKESIHPAGTLFPGSLKVQKENNKFYCPIKNADNDVPNAVCNICLAEKSD